MAVLLAGVPSCAPLPPPPPPPYHAVGTEPFWNVLIDEHHVTFTQPDAQPIRQPTPRVIHGIAGEIYPTPRINVNIVHELCSDGIKRARPIRIGSKSLWTGASSTAAAGFN